MLNGRSSPICLTATILSLSIIILMMMTMVKDCGGSMGVCNGSSSMDCQMVMEEEEQEFLMDTEEHRRILATTYSNSVSYGGLQKGNPACGNNCAGKYDPGGRKCKLYDYSCK